MLTPVFDELYDAEIAEVHLTDVQVQRSVAITDIPRLSARPVHPSDELWQQLSLRRVIEVKGEPWRIEESRFQYSGSGRPRIVAAPLWADLADITYRCAGRLRYTALGVSVDEAVDRALEDTDYSRGGLLPDDREVFITEENISVLGLLRKIAEAVDEELVFDGQEVRIRRHGTGTTKEISSDGAVRRELQRQSSSSSFFTAISPLGGSEDTFVLGDARWQAELDPATNTVTLPEGPIWQDGALAGEARVGFVSTDGSITWHRWIQSTTAPDTIQASSFGYTDSDVSHVVFLDTKNDPDKLTRLVDPDSAAVFGKVERRITEEDLGPHDNLLQNADLSLWDGNNPASWVNSPQSTLTRSTDVADYGTASAKIEANSGAWIAQTVDYLPDKRFPYLSFWIAVRVEQGQIRLEVIDSDGKRLPRGERAISTVDEIRGLSVEGEKAAPGPLTLRVVAEEDDTIFYLDGATLTDSATHYQLTEMGPKALWKRAARMLQEEGGLQADAFTASIWDTGQDIQLGDQVEVTDKDGADSSFTFESRVVEITEHIDEDGTLEKELRLSQEREDVVDLPLSPPSRPPLEPLEPKPQPRVEARYFVDGSTGKAEIKLEESDGRLQKFEYIAAEGDALSDAEWQEAEEFPFVIEISLLEKHNCTIQWRASFDNLPTQTGSHTFDVLDRPAADYSVSFFGTDPMSATLVWRGDADTAEIDWRRDSGSWQTATGRSGSVSIGTVTKGEQLRVRAVAKSESGTTEERTFDQTIQVPLQLEDVATEAVSSLNLLKGDIFVDGDEPLSVSTDGQSIIVALTRGDTLDVQEGKLEAREVTGEERLGFAMDTFAPGGTAGVTPPQDLRPDASPFFTSITSPDYVPKAQGWKVGPDADFRSVTADELRVKAFISEVAQAYAGEQLLTQSLGTLAEPASIQNTTSLVVDALPGFSGVSQFAVGDVLRMRIVDRGAGVSGQPASVLGYEDKARLEIASHPIATGDLEAHMIFEDGTSQELPVTTDGGRVVETPVVTDPVIIVVIGKHEGVWHATPIHRIEPAADIGYGVWTVALTEVELETDDPVLTTMDSTMALSGQIDGLDVSDVWLEVDDIDVVGDGTIRYETTLKRGAQGKIAPVGSLVLSYGQGGGFLMERSVIGAGAPYDRQLEWNPGPDGLPESYEVITYSGDLSALPKAYASGPGFYSENLRATGSLLVGSLDKSGDYIQYEDGVLQISGTVQVGEGDLDDIIDDLARTDDLGGLAFQDWVEQSRLGTTIIEEGFIKTTLLDVDAIAAQVIDTDELFTEDFTLKGDGAITAEDERFRISASQGVVINSNAVPGDMQARSIQWSPDPLSPSLSSDVARIELTDLGVHPTLRLHSTGLIQMGGVAGTEVLIRHNEAQPEDHLVRMASNGDVEVITNRYLSAMGVLSVDGDIEATGTITSPSDAKYKTAVADLSFWDDLDLLQPRRFTWQEIRSGDDIGFVAQELQSVVPEAVKEMRNGDLAVDYAKLSTVAIASLKQAKERIDLLETRIINLESA